MIQRTRTLLVGFDSAWTAHNRGAIAAIALDADGRRIEVGLPRTASYQEAEQTILEWQAEWNPEQTFILLDEPTVVTNTSGQRPVENTVCSSVSARRGGMQPANTSRVEMFGEGAPVWRFLDRFGGAANPVAPDTIVTIETYPVLTLIALSWTLPDSRTKGRLPKYNPERRKTFSLSDWRFLCGRLAEALHTEGCFKIAAGLEEAARLETPRKSDQDKLDACLCLLTAIYYAERKSQMVGDTRTGYIVVPHGEELHGELSLRCSIAGRVHEEWVRAFRLRKPINLSKEGDMTKTWQQMASTERIADRIMKNRESERSAVKSPLDWTVDRIAQKLNEGGQRATYSAVAGVVGGLARGVMQGRNKSSVYSWIVAINGVPTGYPDAQIHPDCLRQINEGNDNLIRDGKELRDWLER